MDVDGAGVAIIFKAPHFVQQLVTRIDPVGVPSQAGQQFQLFGRRIHHFTLHFQLIAVHIQVQVVKVINAFVFFILAAAAAQNSLDTGRHFLGFKRLYDVIIRTQFQA